MFCYLWRPISPCHWGFGLWSPSKLPVTAKYYQRLGCQPTLSFHSYTIWKDCWEKGGTRAATVLHGVSFTEDMWQAASAIPRLLYSPAVLQPQRWVGTSTLRKCFDKENLRLCTQNQKYTNAHTSLTFKIMRHINASPVKVPDSWTAGSLVFRANIWIKKRKYCTFFKDQGELRILALKK